MASAVIRATLTRLRSNESVNTQILKTLRTLARERRTGILTCQGVSVTRHVVLREGDVASARSSDDAERLGEVMVRQGTITEQHLKDATVFAKKGRRLGEVLVELNIIKSEEVEESVRMQILEVSSNVMIQPPKPIITTRGIIKARTISYCSPSPRSLRLTV